MAANSEDSSDILSSSHICNCLPVTTESCCLTVISARLTDPSTCREPPPRFLTRHLLARKGVRDWASSRYNTHKPHLALPLPVMREDCSDQTLNLRLHPEFQGFPPYHHYSLCWRRKPQRTSSSAISLFFHGCFFFFTSLSISHVALFPFSWWTRCKSPRNRRICSQPFIFIASRISGGRTRAADASAATCCT